MTQQYGNPYGAHSYYFSQSAVSFNDRCPDGSRPELNPSAKRQWGIAATVRVFDSVNCISNNPLPYIF